MAEREDGRAYQLTPGSLEGVFVLVSFLFLPTLVPARPQAVEWCQTFRVSLCPLVNCLGNVITYLLRSKLYNQS